MVNYTKKELLAVLTSRALDDGISVFIGIGISQLAVELARKMGKTRLISIYEGGSIDPFIKPPFMPYSTNDIRVGYRALMYPSCVETFTYMQRGYIDLALMGAAQIDIHGNVNSSLIRSEKGLLRLPGSGGANDLASLAGRTIIVAPLEKRRFIENVDHITSPGWLNGSRNGSGLIGKGPYKVITDMAIFGFNHGIMRLEAVIDGLTVDDVLSSMSFKPEIGDVKTIDPPSEVELSLLREIDRDGIFLRD
ncbi:MAG: CoA-transferase [Conexivisphaerales archaeon]